MAVHLTRIYTRTGDDGTTGLGDFSRVPKTDPRLGAYADVDEANCALGVALALGALAPRLVNVLRQVQNDLFDVGADLCRPERDSSKTPLRVTEQQVLRLEHQIDHFNAALEPLTSFVLPGGSSASAYLHLARAAVRRAERDIAELAASEPVNPEPLKFVNRLSDLLFVLARYMNGRGAADVLWIPGLSR